MSVVREFTARDLNGQDITMFFNSVTLYEFGGEIVQKLGGLSSMDGSRAYNGESALLGRDFSKF